MRKHTTLPADTRPPRDRKRTRRAKSATLDRKAARAAKYTTTGRTR